MKIRSLPRTAVLSLALVSGVAAAESPPPALRPYLSVIDPTGGREPLALQHLELIDGTGAPPRKDVTLVIRGGTHPVHPRAGPGAAPGARPVDLSGRTVLPGLVDMHGHLYYADNRGLDSEGRDDPTPTYVLTELPVSFPRLYLAGGVTTVRTTGAVEPSTDLEVKRRIERGELPGPDLFLTAPYLEGVGGGFIQMHALGSPAEARKWVEFWASQGATSFKAYMHLTRAELQAAIKAAHALKLPITGHLCAVTYREAAELGIDDLEHGFMVDTSLVPGKLPDVCPSSDAFIASRAAADPDGAPVRSLFALLIKHHVAITSTLPVFESSVWDTPAIPEAQLSLLTADAQRNYLWKKAATGAKHDLVYAEAFARELRLELAFARAGGTLLAGSDPTGNGGVLPGFGQVRELELLVKAGFTPLEAIRIGTLEGARFLGQDREIGSIAAGKRANLMIVRGNPAARIGDLENVETVFRAGVAYDSRALRDSVRGEVGLR